MSSVGHEDLPALPPSSVDQQSFPGAPPLPAPIANNAHSEIPPLEPPAPVAVRVRSRADRLKWWLDRGQELPSWMTSMVLHLAITILFASLAVKSGPRPNAVFVLDLSATMADQIDDHSSAIEIMPFEFSPLSVSQEDSKTTLVVVEEPLAIPIEAPTEPPKSGNTESQVEEAQETAPADEAVESIADAEEAETDELDFLFAAHAANPFGDELPFPTGAPQASAKSPAPAKPKTLAHDDIVKRFIEYDIGNLTGAAGKRAQREFNQLGPDAIPAIVRGLNQSARIQASCPVVVLSNKLEQTMQQTNDRATIDYVLQNLGRDVPHNAPHAKRIESLRAKLAATFVDRQFYEDFRGIRPIRDESQSQWVARVKRLYQADADGLAAALQDERPQERTAAWAAIAMRPRFDLAHSDRMRLAEVLLDDWPNHTEVYRKRIHDALTTLAVGSGAANGPPNFSRQQTGNTLSRWQLWWSDAGQMDPEAASAELLRLAKFANEHASQRLLVRAVEKFPGTRNAELARHMLPPDTRLALARSFERQRRWQEAILVYQEIATEFPDSQHAPTAQQRLNAIGRFREPERASRE